MDFRSRLLLGLVVLAVTAAGLQAGLGFWQFKAALDRDFQGDLAKYLSLVEEATLLTGLHPALNPAKLPVSEELQGRIRLVRDGEVLLEYGGPFPAPAADAAWVQTARQLPGGYRLEVALNARDHNRSLEEYLRTSLLAFLLSIGLAVLLAVGLRRFLMRPLGRLEAATVGLTQQRFPEALPVAGQDELARLTRSFNRMVEKLRQATERERSFTRYASHELRNPLAAIKANLGAARAGALPPEECFEAVGDNLEQMERTLDGLLGLARGMGEPDKVGLALLLSELVAGLPEADRIRVELAAGDAHLWLPEAAFAGAVRNLLENALRYSQGAVELTLSHPPGNRLCLRVRDHGAGVPEAALHRLGEPFYRLRRETGGTGMGLAYARQVAEALGGSLHFLNHPEGGLEATLYLSETLYV